jgi:hypothetical protein
MYAGQIVEEAGVFRSLNHRSILIPLHCWTAT